MADKIGLFYNSSGIETGGTNALTGAVTGATLVDASHKFSLPNLNTVYTGYYAVLDDTTLADTGNNTSGTFTVTVPTGIQVCATSNGTFAQSATVAQALGAFKPVYFKRTAVGATTLDVEVGTGGVIFTAGTRPVVVFSDDFSGTLANWTLTRDASGSTTNSFSIVGGALRCAFPSRFRSYAKPTVSAALNSRWSWKYKAKSGTLYAELHFRSRVQANGDCYLAYFGDVGLTAGKVYCFIFKFVGGTFTQIGAVATPSIAANDVFTFDVSGNGTTTLTLKKNGTTIITGTDATSGLQATGTWTIASGNDQGTDTPTCSIDIDDVSISVLRGGE